MTLLEEIDIVNSLTEEEKDKIQKILFIIFLFKEVNSGKISSEGFHQVIARGCKLQRRLGIS